ncbi:MAG: CopD family protein [Chloroflexi bacterium]|nr:CopD family protein [Chloroflexota bacterium]
MSWSLVIVTLHILAAITWVGGMIFLAMVTVPALRGLEPPLRAAVLRAVGRRFRVVGWGALTVLVITGLLNAARYGYGPYELVTGQWLESDFGRLLALKLALVAAMAGLTLAHDLVGQRANALATRAPARGPALGGHPQESGPDAIRDDASTPEALRARSSWLAAVNLFVALMAVVAAILLVRM